MLRVTQPDYADVDNDANTTELVDLYYHENSIGSIAALTRADGVMVEAYRYDAYGALDEIQFRTPSTGILVTVAQSQVKNTTLWQGRQLDAEEGSGLYYFRNRFYSPSLGRFVSRDPKGIWGDAAQLGNGQSAFGNNPLNNTDPLGLEDPRTTYERIMKWFRGGDKPEPAPTPYARIPSNAEVEAEMRAAGMDIEGSSPSDASPFIFAVVWWAAPVGTAGQCILSGVAGSVADAANTNAMGGNKSYVEATADGILGGAAGYGLSRGFERAFGKLIGGGKGASGAPTTGAPALPPVPLGPGKVVNGEMTYGFGMADAQAMGGNLKALFEEAMKVAARRGACKIRMRTTPVIEKTGKLRKFFEREGSGWTKVAQDKDGNPIFEKVLDVAKGKS